MPRSSCSWEGAEALWITAAGWASAAKRNLGDAVVVTSDKIAAPHEVWNYPLLPDKNGKAKRRKFSLVPAFLKILINDLFTWWNLKNWKVLENLNLEGRKPAFIWEKHDLFVGPGKSLATKYNVPFISYVHAPVVWEASKWGVKRYWWGKWLESVEARNLKKADLVAVVSEEVKQKILQMGISEEKILISPMAVEPELFAHTKASELRNRLNLTGKTVIGWTGSFRKFHGLDHLIKAFKEVSDQSPETILMLVGDGSERKDCEELVRKLGIQEKVIFTGRIQFSNIPKYVSLFDIAVVSARSGEGFHYSPLKLREYMAAGKAVLAPNAGEIPENFEDENVLKLFNSGDINSLAEGMCFLIKEEEKRKIIAANGKDKILKTSTWDIELKKALEYLEKNK
ncbi:glycosyltransferase family 4 protein [Salinimicrobium gaetbulicola]|uniref:Glycosyltransferase family 4 protein n=1 Tax=Salinimicrobium gaetbulicola TaxID=999702 RepID=A0ABW3ICK0_9FLAO